MTSRFAIAAVLLASACATEAESPDLAPSGPVVSGKGDGFCPAVSANLGVTEPQQFLCAPVSARSAAEMADVNRFWASNVALCGCAADQPDCSNATAMTGGWIYASNDFVEGMRTSGSNMPTQYIFAHEFGHELQGVFGVPSITQVKELQADCLAGYYLGSLSCRSLVTEADVVATLATACIIADGTGDPVSDLDTHGTCEQRVGAVVRGMRGYLANEAAFAACAL